MAGENRTRSVEAVEVPYRPAIGARPYEIFSLSSLINRIDRAELSGYQQLDFDLVIVCTDGIGQHEVDFETVAFDSRRLLHLRPGQVHRWMLAKPYEATLVLLRPLVTRTDWASGPRIIPLTDDQAHDLEAILTLAKHQPRSGLFSPTVGENIRQLLVAGLGLVGDGAAGGGSSRSGGGDPNPLVNELRRALSSDDYRNRSVAHYAKELGCSTKTLTRSCLQATEMGPKRLIDTEVAMAAQRLLCLPGATVSSVAQHLAFDEITNFTKFFKRMTGTPPSTWQETVAGPSGPSH
jgi:AraC-like DNA-binding protein